MRGELATPPLWGGVGWPILHMKKRLGQEYSFGGTLHPSRASQLKSECPGTHVLSRRKSTTGKGLT